MLRLHASAARPIDLAIVDGVRSMSGGEGPCAVGSITCYIPDGVN